MKASREESGGQSIVETVLLLPLLLILLAGGYWAFRNLALSGSAESASHADMLRTGRNLSSIRHRLSRMILPDDNAVLFRDNSGHVSGIPPLFRGMSGTTIVRADVSLPKEPVGAFLDLPAHSIRREGEGAVDCWGSGTKSGSAIRRTVSAIVASGAFR